jgi:hypothetical protein
LTEDLRVDVHRNSVSGVTAWYKCTDNDGKKVSAWNSGKRPAKSSEGVEVEPEIQIRLRIVKKGTLEQFLVGDKAKSLREASLKVSNPAPYTLHPTPYTLHPTPYTLHQTWESIALGRPRTLNPKRPALRPNLHELDPAPTKTLRTAPYRR